MAIMEIEDRQVSKVRVGDLLHIKERIFAGVKDIDEGHGVRTLHVFGYSSRTLGAHQSVGVAA